jgi:hypothetical protein
MKQNKLRSASILKTTHSNFGRRYSGMIERFYACFNEHSQGLATDSGGTVVLCHPWVGYKPGQHDLSSIL